MIFQQLPWNIWMEIVYFSRILLRIKSHSRLVLLPNFAFVYNFVIFSVLTTEGNLV